MTDPTPITKNVTVEWKQIPAKPKVPNFWQGGGYTLHYASPGWDVHEGTHDSKDTLGDVLFHARTAKDAKQWVVDNAKPVEDDKPAKPKRVRKPKGKAASTAADNADDVPPPDSDEAAAAHHDDTPVTDVWDTPSTDPFNEEQP
jgi:hypothetical protein